MASGFGLGVRLPPENTGTSALSSGRPGVTVWAMPMAEAIPRAMKVGAI